LASLVLFSVGCDAAPADLAPAAVQSIAPGDATGSALDGSYGIQRVTTSCRGACGGLTSFGVAASVCDVGALQPLTARVTQAGGALTIEVDDTPAVYHGAVFADGRVDVGAYATQDSSLSVTVRVTGDLATGRLDGSARSHFWGSIAGVGIDCLGAYQVTSVTL
jgi:hypothetical protein